MVSRIIGLRNNLTQHYTKYIIIRVSLWLNSAAEKFESCYVLRINYYKSGVTENVYRFGLDLWICGSPDSGPGGGWRMPGGDGRWWRILRG